MVPIHETATGCTFAIRVHPRGRKDAIVGELGDALKLTLSAPPIDGRANDACIVFFAQLLRVQRAAITIVSGGSSRNKLIHIAGLSGDELRARLTK